MLFSVSLGKFFRNLHGLKARRMSSCESAGFQAWQVEERISR